MRGRGVLIALIVSLAVNLFLISAGASAFLAAHHAPTVQNPGLRRAVGALPAGDRQAFLALLRSNGGRVRPENRRARALRDQAWSGLADGTEAPDIIKRQLADARAINQATRAAVEDSVVNYGIGLDASGRHALGEALRPPAPSRKPR